MKQTSRRLEIRSLAFAALLGLALGQAEPAFPATLGINPTRILLSASSRSALITLTNQTDEESRVEVSVSSWSEDTSGNAILEPSDDLAVYPLLVAIPPRGEKRLRVGLAKREPILTERSYRLFLQELPPSTAAIGQVSVRMVLRLALPVHVQPAKPAGSVSAELLVVEGGCVRLRLANPGNAHARIEEASVTGKGTGGATVFTRNLDLRVLLAGGRRDFELPLSEEECRLSGTLELRVRVDAKTVSTGVKLEPASCGR